MTDDLFDHLIRRMTGQEVAVSARSASPYAQDWGVGFDGGEGWEQTEPLTYPSASVRRPNPPPEPPVVTVSEQAEAPRATVSLPPVSVPTAALSRPSASTPAPRIDPPAHASGGPSPDAPVVAVREVTEHIFHHEGVALRPLPAAEAPAKGQNSENIFNKITRKTNIQNNISNNSHYIIEQTGPALAISPRDVAVPRQPPAAPMLASPVRAVPMAPVRPQPPTLSIHIDSVEIHAAAPTAVAPRKAAPRRAPALGLDAYLSGKGGRG